MSRLDSLKGKATHTQYQICNVMSYTEKKPKCTNCRMNTAYECIRLFPVPFVKHILEGVSLDE